MNVLLTFTGFNDPYSKGLIGQEDQPGPILSLATAKSFDRIILFSTPSTREITLNTQSALNSVCRTTDIEIRDIPVDDPTDYAFILKELRKHIREIQEDHFAAFYFVAVASGTPQMHACWVLLTAAGEIPARLLNIRPPRFVTRDRPVITEIDLTSKEFPIIRPPKELAIELDDSAPNVQETLLQLGIVGDHPSMQRALEMGAMLASSNAPILVLGETGTGKELFSRFIHRLSGRPRDKFIAINCAAIPEDLVESILFGHKKGAFTGAVSDQVGKFDVADKGTLFLDELGELPLAAQAKFLRTLQDGIIEPVGDRKAHKVDVRVIAATNRDLRKQVRQGNFREDLFYRLNVGEITLPPLRERRSDIPKLALYVLDKINGSLRRPKRLSPGALARLQGHSWPGNVRDLENVIERSARLCRADVLDTDDLLITDPVAYADPLDALPDPYDGFSLEQFLGSARKQLLLRALEITNGKQSEAARLLGITPQAVHKFVQHSNTGLNRS